MNLDEIIKDLDRAIENVEAAKKVLIQSMKDRIDAGFVLSDSFEDDGGNTITHFDEHWLCTEYEDVSYPLSECSIDELYTIHSLLTPPQ